MVKIWNGKTKNRKTKRKIIRFFFENRVEWDALPNPNDVRKQ